MQQAVETEIFKVTHSIMQLWSKQLKCYIGAGTKTHKTKTPETDCKGLLNLKYCI